MQEVTKGSMQTEVDIYSLCFIRYLWKKGEADMPLSTPFVFPKESSSRSEFVFSGLSAVNKYLQNYRLTVERIELLRHLPVLQDFPTQFWNFAKGILFKGRIRSLKDGDVFRVDEVFFELEGQAAQVLLCRQGAKTMLSHEIGVATSAAELKDAAGSKPVRDLASVRTPDLFTCLRYIDGVRTAGFDIPSPSQRLAKYVVTCLAGGVESQRTFLPACLDRIRALAAHGNLNFEVHLSDV